MALLISLKLYSACTGLRIVKWNRPFNHSNASFHKNVALAMVW
jgi:hypothetical protein